MLLHFTKMHGLGNDFMVVDMVTQSMRITPEKILSRSDRNFGVGFDQLLVVEPPTDPNMDFRYRIFNADGNEVEQCGNGARCFARFVRDKRLIGKDIVQVQTASGNIALHIQENGDVTVDMGIPRLEPKTIPFKASNAQNVYDLDVDGERLQVGVVSLGNPHAIWQVQDVDCAPVARIGPKIENHKQFPKRCNAGFMQILDANEINLRVYERGVGETLACGTAACAAVVFGRLQGLLDEEVRVNLLGGTLQIKWSRAGQSVMMTGSATRVFEGQTRI